MADAGVSQLVDLETMLKDLTLLDWSTGQTEVDAR